MSTLKTIQVPTHDGPLVEVQGRVVFLYVANVQEKFLLQQTRHGEVLLTHYASGLCVGSLTPIHLRAARGRGSKTDREAAIELLADLSDKHGAETVRQRLDSAPVINP